MIDRLTNLCLRSSALGPVLRPPTMDQAERDGDQWFKVVAYYSDKTRKRVEKRYRPGE